jgi:hypothetical protein
LQLGIQRIVTKKREREGGRERGKGGGKSEGGERETERKRERERERERLFSMSLPASEQHLLQSSCSKPLETESSFMS